MSLRQFIAKLARARDGVAVVEFAFWSVLLSGVLLYSADFGQYTLEQSRLARAVSETSMHAYNSRDAVNVDELRRMLLQSSDLPGTPPEVAITCNGGTCTNSSRICGCMAGDGTIGGAATCGSSCSGGGSAGYYLTIRASYTYDQPILSASPVKGRTMSQTSTVQLQ